MRAKMPELPQLLSGETVAVLTRSVAYDEHMEAVETWEREEVGNVLVAPGSTSDVAGTARPDGTRAAFTLGFPKTFSKPLRGCRVVVRGSVYSVIGDPQPNTSGNCPTRWWYTAEVEAVDG